jgi:hypothetical protein
MAFSRCVRAHTLSALPRSCDASLIQPLACQGRLFSSACSVYGHCEAGGRGGPCKSHSIGVNFDWVGFWGRGGGLWAHVVHADVRAGVA